MKCVCMYLNISVKLCFRKSGAVGYWIGQGFEVIFRMVDVFNKNYETKNLINMIKGSFGISCFDIQCIQFVIVCDNI